MNIKQALVILADKDHKFSLRILIVGLLLVIFLVLFLGISKTVSSSHLQEIIDRGTLKVITRSSPTTFYLGYQGPEGVEFQLASRFAESLGVELEITSVDSISDIFNALQTGQAYRLYPGHNLFLPKDHPCHAGRRNRIRATAVFSIILHDDGFPAPDWFTAVPGFRNLAPYPAN